MAPSLNVPYKKMRTSHNKRSLVETLSKDVLAIIYGSLDLRSILRCTSVCMLWYLTITTCGDFWANMDFSICAKKVTTKIFVRLINKYGPFVRNLDISCLKHVSPVGYNSLLTGNLRLTSLNVSNCHCLPSKVFDALVKNSRYTLDVLIVRMDAVSNVSLVLAFFHCKIIKFVDISCSKNIILGCCLTRAFKLLKRPLPLLKLCASQCNVSPSDINIISQTCPHLKELILDSIICESILTMNMFSSFFDLEMLSLKEINFVITHEKVNKFNLSASCDYPVKLKQLSIINSTIDSFTVNNILRNLPSLVSLNLTGSSYITDDAFLNLLPNPKLKKLILSSCSRLTDKVISSILANCIYLEHLDISSTSVSGSVVCLIANESPYLQYLDLSNISSITDASISNILQRRGTKLITLNINNCINISTSTVHLLRQVLPTVVINASRSI